MMEWEDYFRILQVHVMAEPEIIKSAYLRLSKKYHPDANMAPDAQERMQAINRAYKVLSNPAKRKEFLIQWIERYNSQGAQDINDRPIQGNGDFDVASQKVLTDYLNCIYSGDIHSAYGFLSEADRLMIREKDFIMWQSLVAEVFALIHFECEVEDTYSNVKIGGAIHETVVNFLVRVVEKNRLRGKIEEDEFLRSMVYENNEWRVYLGYQDLSPIIQKFDQMAQLTKQKHLHVANHFSRAAAGPISGLLGRKQFMAFAQREQLRFNRYGNEFSLILLEIRLHGAQNARGDEILNQAGDVIAGSLRQLDLACRWRDRSFLILLPETDVAAANMAIGKIQKNILTVLGELDMRYSVLAQTYSTFQKLKETLEEKAREAFFI